MTSDLTLLPRSIDRGLIEAKLNSGRPLSLFRLPRSIDRGLIEAVPLSPGGPGGPSFRDLLIAASLKHLRTHGQRHQFSQLPRSIDRGLIEACPPCRAGASLSPLPRSIDRGLIEANKGG